MHQSAPFITSLFSLIIKALEKRLAISMAQCYGGQLSFPEKTQMLTLFREINSREYIQVRSLACPKLVSAPPRSTRWSPSTRKSCARPPTRSRRLRANSV